MDTNQKLKIAKRLPWLINLRAAREEGIFLWEGLNSIPKEKRNCPIKDEEWAELQRQYNEPPKLIFSCLGFRSCEVFIEKCGRQLNIGSIREEMRAKGEDTYTFWSYEFFKEHYVKREGYVDMEEVPTPEFCIEEYKRQFAQHGVKINKDILYAG